MEEEEEEVEGRRGEQGDGKREIFGQSPIARLLLCPYAAAIHAYLTR